MIFPYDSNSRFSDSKAASPTQRPAWAERYWAKVNKRAANGCWEWTASSLHGYGKFTIANGVTKQAHRVAYELLVGPIPEGLVLDHLCRNPPCVNPDHLEPVTYQENSRRSPLVLRPACKAGHPYVEGSYYVYMGVRVCKTCQIAKVRAHQATVDRTARWTCGLCGRDFGVTYRSKHMRRAHPDVYQPRKSEGWTPERKARKLEKQRERRRRQRQETGKWES